MIVLAAFTILCIALAAMGFITGSESLAVTGVLGAAAFIVILVAEALS